MTSITSEEEFINLVSQYPVLYDKKNINYRNNKLKVERWNSIGRRCGMSGEDAQKKFKSYREKYHREKKIEEKLTRSGAGQSTRTKWHLYDIMSFLNDCTEPRPTNSNIQDEAICSEIEYLEEEFSGNFSEQSVSLMDMPTKKNPDLNNTFNEKYSCVDEPKRKRQKYDTSHDIDITESMSSLSPVINKKRDIFHKNVEVQPVMPRSRIKKANDPVPYIESRLEKLTDALLQEEKKVPDPDRATIDSFCKHIAEEMYRLPVKEVDDLKHSIYELLFKKMRENNERNND